MKDVECNIWWILATKIVLGFLGAGVMVVFFNYIHTLTYLLADGFD